MSQSYVPMAGQSNSASPSCDCLAHVYGNAADRPERQRRYPTDMTDVEWAEVRPLLPLPGWMHGRGGRPEGYCHRAMLALALFQQDSYDDVAENLVGGLGEMDQSIPNKSSFTRARQQLGATPLEAVFRRVAGVIAPLTLEAAFWRGMRVAAVDGFLLDVPENDVTRAAFGGQVDSAGRPVGFPQARVVTLTETGTHATIDARIGSFKGGGGEPALATEMADSAAGMLVIMDRGFPGVALWKAYTQAGAHLLIRARTFIAAKPMEILPDGSYLTRMNLAGASGDPIRAA